MHKDMLRSIEERIRRTLPWPGHPLNDWGHRLLRRWLAQPALFIDLEHRVLDLMAVPQLRCGRRRCRRDGSCRLSRRDDGRAGCIDNLEPAEHDAFAELLRWAMRRYFDLGPPTHLPPSELHLASLELEKAIAPKGDYRLAPLRRFWRQRSAARRESRRR